MNIRPVSEWTLYRYRFWLGYAFLAVVVGVALFLQIGQMPQGLGPSEKDSIIASANLKLTEFPANIIDLPYHVMQKASLSFLGVTPIGVRLPSLVIGGLTAIIFVLLLRRWFKPNVTIVAALVVLTSAWFVATARLGAPFIMMPFWTSLILLAATALAQESPRWKWWWLLAIIAAACSLYTPVMAYLFLAAWIASLTQPHLRYLIRKTNPLHYLLTTIIFAIPIVPLGIGLYQNSDQIWHLLAIPSNLPAPPEFARDLITATSNLFNPLGNGFGETITPLLGLASSALLLLGGIRLLRDSHAIRTYTLLIWGAILVPIVGLNPTNLTFLLVPAMLVTATGVQLIISYWYRLFPRNPYARIFGMLPLAVLVLSVVQFNNQRYIYGTIYGEGVTKTFVSDAFLAQNKVYSLPTGNNLTIVVAEGEEPLYNLIARKRVGANVVTASQVNLTSGTWLIAESELPKIAVLPGEVPSELIVNQQKEDSLRFRLYSR